MKTKLEIKIEVIQELKPIYNPLFEGFDMNTEGSLSETYYYMSMPNVMKILELCFDKTYDKTINTNIIMEKTKSLEKVDLPDGEYNGLWSGFYINVLLSDNTRSEDIKVNNGVKGINSECEVEIVDGWLYVE